jgi:hypothetical protein
VLYFVQEACPLGRQVSAGGGEVAAKCRRQTTHERCQSFQVGDAEDQQNHSSRCALHKEEEGGPSCYGCKDGCVTCAIFLPQPISLTN